MWHGRRTWCACRTRKVTYRNAHSRITHLPLSSQPGRRCCQPHGAITCGGGQVQWARLHGGARSPATHAGAPVAVAVAVARAPRRRSAAGASHAPRPSAPWAAGWDMQAPRIPMPARRSHGRGEGAPLQRGQRHRRQAFLYAGAGAGPSGAVVRGVRGRPWARARRRRAAPRRCPWPGVAAAGAAGPAAAAGAGRRLRWTGRRARRRGCRRRRTPCPRRP